MRPLLLCIVLLLAGSVFADEPDTRQSAPFFVKVRELLGKKETDVLTPREFYSRLRWAVDEKNYDGVRTVIAEARNARGEDLKKLTPDQLRTEIEKETTVSYLTVLLLRKSDDAFTQSFLRDAKIETTRMLRSQSKQTLLEHLNKVMSFNAKNLPRLPTMAKPHAQPQSETAPKKKGRDDVPSDTHQQLIGG